MSVTYTRLRSGEWGLRGAALNEGQRVIVTKRDGTTKTEAVGRVLWRGDGVALATIRRDSGGRGGREYPAAGCDDCAAEEDFGAMNGCSRHRGNSRA